MRGLASAPTPLYLAAVIIRTERLLLRAPAIADAARISLLAGDFEVASMTGTIPHPYSEEMAADWIRSHQDGEEGVAFAIDLGGDLIGCVGYRAYDAVHAEMGYWLGKPYWGFGFATEAARALIRHVFQTKGFDYVTCGHFRENPASARVIAKLGFEASGEVLRDCAARGNKSRCVTYRLTRERALAPVAEDLPETSFSEAGTLR
jgi:ribosomal-protein-alanine N-acetyltransferase